MKTRLIIAIGFVIWLCGIAPAFAANPLDIVLEGPWILYQDHAFLNGTKKVDVLIVMAPGVYDSAMPEYNPHHDPIFSVGDGFKIEQGIHCVGFDKVCAKKRAATGLNVPGSSKILPVAAPSGWNWWSNRTTGDHSVYLILPMPDSWKNDGVYHMRFGKDFKQYGADEQHSIGLVLHYKSGPKTLSLATCTPKDGSPVNGTDCIGWSDEFDNTDTLQIVMKAPDVDDACDRHVRSAYPAMLRMIDSLGASNKGIAYIDPAVSVKAGAGQYDVPDCYDCDTQDPNYDRQKCKLKTEGMPAPIGIAALLKEIDDVIGKLVPVANEVDQEESKDGIPPGKRPPLYASRLRQEYDSLNKLYPRLSQLREIKLLLILSADNIHETSILLAANAQPLSAVQPNGNVISLSLLKIIEDTERTVATHVDVAIPTKNGGDCRAPAMLVK